MTYLWKSMGLSFVLIAIMILLIIVALLIQNQSTKRISKFYTNKNFSWQENQQGVPAKNCIKCGCKMIIGLDVNADYYGTGTAPHSPVVTPSGEFGLGGGETVYVSGTAHVKIQKREYIGKVLMIDQYRTTDIGNLKAAVCPECGEVSLYLEVKEAMKL